MLKQPNIIIFLSDQQRFDTVGCYGQKLNVTPNLDRLAKEGTVFENAFTCQPVCGPARACIQTGLYATQTGCYKNDVSLPETIPTIAKILSQNGYETAYIGKWHLASSGPNENHMTGPVPESRRGGYEYWMAADVLELTSDGYEGGYVFDSDLQKQDFTGYRADRIGEYALDYIKKQQNSEKPFLLFVSWIEPHQQNDKDIVQGPDYSKDMFKEFIPPGDLEKGVGNWEANYPDYLGACHSIDRNVGEVVDYLRVENKLEQTVILYTSDHGCHFKTRNWEYKRTCHEASIRIPIIAYGKGFFRNKRITQLTSLIDIAPTVLKTAGIDILGIMQGIPLQDFVKVNSSVKSITDSNTNDNTVENIVRNEIFIQMSETQVGRALRTEKWKYAVNAPDKDGYENEYSEEYLESHLYDLENDPYEKNNLVSNKAYGEKRRELRKKLLQYISSVENKKSHIKGIDT